MSYEFYKVIHLVCIILVVGAVAIQFFKIDAPKSTKILSGLGSVLILVSGMGLIARLGVPHGAPWPIWIKVKLGLWVAIAALAPILAKRMKSNRALGYYGLIVLFIAAIFTAVTKLA